MKQNLVGKLIMISAVLAAPAVMGQGSLTPPGPPAPTMKTLDQVEPRTPISSLPFVINRAGSYYLTTNLVGIAGQNGVTIQANDVTLDLRGFALIGVAASIDGVNVPISVTNIAVINGTATGWGGMGFDIDTADNSLLSDLRATRNLGNGISLGRGGIIRNCAAQANGSAGIRTADKVLVTGNVATGNTADGIVVSSDCQVLNNNSDGNGAGAGSGAGIHATGNNNRIEANSATGNDRGLDIDSTGNTVVNNSVARNTVNYDIVSGNQLNLLLSQLPQTISWPAHVLLAGSLSGVAGSAGITISVNNVTIDLGGHALLGVAGALDGITTSAVVTNVSVRNGSIEGWPGDGVDVANAANSQLVNVSSARNTGNGLLVGEGGLISGCTARGNGADGIHTGSGCRLVDCSSSRNTGDGFDVSTGSTLSGCAAYDNAGEGINGSTACTVIGCSAYSNTGFGIEAANSSSILQSSVYANATNGIVVTAGSRVSGCTVRLNGGHGISISTDSEAENNNCAANTLAGIFVSGSRTRIDSNNMAGGQRGIQVTGTGNFIVRNSVNGASVADYDIVAGNANAQVLAPGAAFVASNPWANFSY